jgi:hypothetical protein
MANGEKGKAGDARKVAVRRADRLRSALRENLRRRKAQARARAQLRDAGDGASHDSAGIVPVKSQD